jgi:hypothetical protein
VVPVCVGSYLMSVLRVTFLIFDACHPDALSLHDKDVRIRGYFLNPKGVSEQISSENAGLYLTGLTMNFLPVWFG